MMKGWFISDVKGSNVEQLFLSMKVPNIDLVYLEDVELVLDYNHPNQFLIGGQWVEKPDFVLCTLESVLHEDMSYVYTISHLLEQLGLMGVYCFPNPELMSKSGDKLRTAQLLAQAGVPTPRTYMLTQKSNPSFIAKELGLPVVVKIPNGSKGQGISLAHNVDELNALMQDELKQPGDILLAQEFIATSKGRDVRVTLADGELVFSLLRDNTKNGDFRSNVSLGGTASIIEPSEEMMDIACRAAKALGADWCGVDLLFAENGFMVGEVNSFPGLIDNMYYKGEDLKLRYIRMLMEMIAKKVAEKKQKNNE